VKFSYRYLWELSSSIALTISKFENIKEVEKMIFVSKQRDYRILIDAGGTRVVGNELKRFPARWVDFSPNGQAEVLDKDIIEKLKHMPGYGTEFTAVTKGAPRLKEEEKDVFDELDLE